MLPSLRTRTSAITFDVGAAGVRAIQVERRGGRTRVRDALRVDAGEADTTPAAGAELCGRLAALVSQGNFTGRNVALVLSPPDVQFHPLQLPEAVLQQPPELAAEAVRWEVAREVRTEPDALEVRYWPLPTATPTSPNVMAVSIPQERVRHWFESFRAHGLQLTKIDVSATALTHLGCRLRAPAPDDLWAVLDIGQRQSTLTVVASRTPTYIRSLPTASQHWTERLAEALDMPGPDAERVKRACGLGASDKPEGPGVGPLERPEIAHVLAEVLRSSLETLVRDLSRCLAYVLQAQPRMNLVSLVLAGGGGALRGLPDFLESHVGVPVLRFAEAKAAASTLSEQLVSWQPRPEDAAACGAALLQVDP